MKTILLIFQYLILFDQKTGVRGKYTNPVINSDFPDPGILRLPDGSGYLGVVSSGNVPDGFPLIWSPDLVTWSPRGHVFPNHTWPDWAASELWAPEIHFVNGRYLCYYAASPEGGKHSIGVAVASSPWGPYEDIGDPIVEQTWNCVACFIDPSYFRDPRTSKQYLLWKGDSLLPLNPSAIYLQELNLDGISFKEGSDIKIILETDELSENLIVEGPWMMFKDNKYFLFYSSSWVTMSSYKVGVAVADSLLGEFVKSGEPVIQTRPAGNRQQCGWLCSLLAAETADTREESGDQAMFEGPGHGSVVEDSAGAWWLVYAVWRAGAVNTWPPGRLMMLDRISWREEGDRTWPYIGYPSQTSQDSPATNASVTIH